VREQQPLYVSQEDYDLLMSLPDGADIGDLFEFLPVPKQGGPAGAAPGTDEDA
jgi:hypothetical protein